MPPGGHTISVIGQYQGVVLVEHTSRYQPLTLQVDTGIQLGSDIMETFTVPVGTGEQTLLDLLGMMRQQDMSVAVVETAPGQYRLFTSAQIVAAGANGIRHCYELSGDEGEILPDLRPRRGERVAQRRVLEAQRRRFGVVERVLRRNFVTLASRSERFLAALAQVPKQCYCDPNFHHCPRVRQVQDGDPCDDCTGVYRFA